MDKNSTTGPHLPEHVTPSDIKQFPPASLDGIINTMGFIGQQIDDFFPAAATL
ncbi:hypothetical protein G6M08_18480 [Agrobacterium rhizogenes]|uniref:Uncharacterized protein n=1 Tax=Rhizobium rhizogenes NBRC 13257 TaxID=1220581 RepID=A0AA87UC11_RHIRH|nr:hypothetical protein [Rhizobium rhizogenes]NTI69672.1 hypothetical protein [Rhizobium rhizogenes]GAJ95773.1 hypothetical protein RRH01S_13_01340 [Rhizobium rhizogenes NBRC 13257]